MLVVTRQLPAAAAAQERLEPPEGLLVVGVFAECRQEAVELELDLGCLGGLLHCAGLCHVSTLRQEPSFLDWFVKIKALRFQWVRPPAFRPVS